jgi:hypothetical protein
VGRALSSVAATLQLVRVGAGSRGVVWERQERETEAAEPGERMGIGPQTRGDDPWKARMRLHQSWWRAEVLAAVWHRVNQRRQHSQRQHA